MKEIKKVSVILPNYNYARYLTERINSINVQTYPIHELIILDDCSTDNSVEVIRSLMDESPGLITRLEVNQVNSGSVFKQWMRGISAASGDYIWIAEADDLSAPTFLEKVMSGFDLDEDVILSYCQSNKINEAGDIKETDYLPQTNEIDTNKWKKPYIRHGIDEICDSLIMKCTIPNVSAVVFKNTDMTSIYEELCDFKLAGDWRFYIWILEKGKIFFHNESLNYHRFHSNSVRESVNKKLDYEEFLKIQDFILEQFDVNKEVKGKVEFIQKAIKKNIQAFENQNYEMYLNNLLEKIEGSERIAVYGTGEAAKFLVKFLFEQNMPVSCVIEEINNEIIGEDLVNVPIVSLADAKITYGIEELIIASNYYQDEIYERIKYLNDDGIRVLKIID